VNDNEVLVLDVPSVEEARKAAAGQWGLDPSDVAVKVIEEEKSFFGLLGRKLRVEARPVAPLSALRGKAMAARLLENSTSSRNCLMTTGSTLPARMRGSS